MKITKLIVFILCLSNFTFSPGFQATGQTVTPGINKVVIDAGHGGKDPGTHFGNFKEKDINLSVALRLGALIREHYPDVEVLYTRETDVFIGLRERADIANKASADLFISIHVNGAKNTAAKGTETFVMGVDKANANLDIAMKENDVITYEEDYTATYEGYTPGSAESFIIFSLMQYSYQAQSMNLANLVQKQYTRNTAMPNRGVKQAGFLVLWYAAMPSILTELGFISNADDRKLLTTKNGQEKLARSLFNAFSEYKVKSEGNGRLIVLDNSGITGDDTELAASTASTGSHSPATGSGTRGAVSSGANTASTGQPIVYRVQVMSSPSKVAKNSSRFGVYRGEVKEIIIDNLYKYYVGEVSSYKDALSLQRQVRDHIQDAFVVAFEGETPIRTDVARQRQP